MHVDGDLFKHAKYSAREYGVRLYSLDVYFEFDHVFGDRFWSFQLCYYLTATLLDYRLWQDHGRLGLGHRHQDR